MTQQELEKHLASSQGRRQASQDNILFFAAYYLPEHVRGPIPQVHKDWFDLANTNPRIAIAAPRGHAKSTAFSLVYVLWCILTNRRRFIVMVSDTASQAGELLGAVIQELETNERIIEDFGRIAGYAPEKSEDKTKWTAKDIVTTTGVKVLAAGWKAKLRGLRHGAYRPDLILLDDVENDESVESELQRDKVWNMFTKSILNLGDVDTQVIIVGTILHYDAMLSRLIQNPLPGWFVRLYMAIEDEKPLWPEVWSLERLEAKRAEIGSIAFEQEFMNSPLDEGSQIIKPAAFYTDIDLTMCDCFGFIDLAISEKSLADYTAIVTIARERKTGHLYVIDPVRMRGSIHDQLNLVFAQHKKYNYKKFGVEVVAYQMAFYQVLVVESRQAGIYLPVTPVEVDKDKVRRAIEVTPHIENGTVKFNNSHQSFMAEIVQFPKGRNDDFVDALVGAIKMALQQGGAASVITGGGITYPKNY